MLVISDTTPLITLMKIKQLQLIKKIFKKIIIPYAVNQELISNPEFQNEAEEIKNSSFIEIDTVISKEKVEKLMTENKLDIGESEAIVLYEEKNAKLLLIDEKKGRMFAQDNGINVMGTIGILVYCVYTGILSQKDCEDCLRRLTQSSIYLDNESLAALEDAIHGKYENKILSKLHNFPNTHKKS